MILIGLGGYGPDNEVGALQSVGLPLDPDLAILNFFVGNDVIGLAMPARVYRGRLYFVGSLDPWVNLLRKSRIMLLAESALVQRLRAGELPSAPTAPHDAGSAAPTRSVDVNATYLGIQEKRIRTYLAEPGGRMRDLWEAAEGYVLEFDRVCRKNGVRCMVHLIPAEIQVDSETAGQVFAGLGLDRSDYDLDMPQRRLRELCEDAGIPVLDPLEHFRERHLADGRLYIPNDTHWNVAGNRLAGELLAEFIAERFMGSADGAVNGPE